CEGLKAAPTSDPRPTQAALTSEFRLRVPTFRNDLRDRIGPPVALLGSREDSHAETHTRRYTRPFIRPRFCAGSGNHRPDRTAARGARTSAGCARTALRLDRRLSELERTRIRLGPGTLGTAATRTRPVGCTEVDPSSRRLGIHGGSLAITSQGKLNA